MQLSDIALGKLAGGKEEPNITFSNARPLPPNFLYMAGMPICADFSQWVQPIAHSLHDFC
ncbi:MAG: hypothetical protein D6814_08545 [Calditrichaeota bacterium]|nr:MAG: hypothetical protein D6814_08545 [Calditrichota bacterium]